MSESNPVPATETNYLDSIGGSQCAAAIGLSPYTQPITLWQEYLGQIPSFEGNELTEWGSAVEPLIRDRYAREHGVEVIVPPSSKVANENWARISPDGIAGKIGFEAKQAGVRVAHLWGEPGTDNIPVQYICQSQWYMWGTGLERWDVAVLIGGNEYHEYIVRRDEELIEFLVSGCRKFWHDNVLAKVPPSIDDTNGYRDYLIHKHPRAANDYKQASADAELIVSTLRGLKDQRRTLESAITLTENELRAEIGDARGLITEIGRITCAERRGRPSWKSVAEAISSHYNVPKEELEQLLETSRSSGSRPITTPQKWNRK